MRETKHANVSLFVPHIGCPHRCSFCNQTEITGQQSRVSAEDVKNAAEIAKKSLGDGTKNAEIAFFGGSFTAIDRDYMLELLKAASVYVKSGEFAGIRLSTRPDAIDKEVLELLRQYGATSIELGAQSMDDCVLELNRRGHTSADVVRSSELIKEYGFSLGLQMMTSLYGSDDEKDTATARALADLSPDTVRIYPTVVMKNTVLGDLFLSGKYCPKNTKESVGLCAGLLRFFESRNISVIRLGLHDSPSLRDSMLGGAFHPAFRELCESRIMFENAVDQINKHDLTGNVIFFVSPSSVSRFVGQKRCNISALAKLGITASVRTDGSLGKYDVMI